MTAIVEDAFHRLDDNFLALSEQELDRPRTRLLRALAGRMWRLNVDPLAELAAANPGQAVDIALHEAVTAFIAHGPVAALEASRRYVQQFPADALAITVFVWSRLLSAVPGAREEAFDYLHATADPTDWRVAPHLAMAMQEAGDYHAAQQIAERAHAVEPAAAHPVHVLAHVHYETGEHAAGRRWLDGWRTKHAIMGYRTHFVWHTALHALAEGDVEEALSRYRTGIDPQSVADAGTLLWRCRLAGESQPDLAAQAVAAADPVLRHMPIAFFVFNACFTLSAAGEADALNELARRLGDDPRPGFADLVAPVARALAALLAGDPAATVALLEPLPEKLARLGGSHAQREIVEDTLIEALLILGRTDHARTVLERRLDRREHALDRRHLTSTARLSPIADRIPT